MGKNVGFIDGVAMEKIDRARKVINSADREQHSDPRR
jgi:hypothetical protein